jgi:hypothetical protein
LDSVSVRVDDLVKDGAKRRRLRRSQILDKIINTNKPASKRSRPPSDQFQINLPNTALRRPAIALR